MTHLDFNAFSALIALTVALFVVASSYGSSPSLEQIRRQVQTYKGKRDSGDSKQLREPCGHLHGATSGNTVAQ